MTITVANGITTDDFTTNTSASYTSGHTDGGSNGTWTFDLANNRLVATGGSDSCYFNSSISLWNSWAEVDMDQSEGGGIQVMRSGTDSCYNLYINDASSASNPNTIQLYGMPGYDLLRSGSIPNFTRGTRHTIRLEVNRYDLTVYFDGVIKAIVGSTDVQAAGNIGMVGGNPGTQHYLRFAIGDMDNAAKPTPAHTPIDGHCIYDYFVLSNPATYKPRLDKFAAGGFKLIMQYYLIYDTTAHMIDYINYAASLGMKVIIALDRTFLWNPAAIQANVPIMYAESGNQSTDAGFTPYVVNQVKNLSGTWGYYVGDEVAFSSKAALQTHIGVITGADNTKPTLQIQSDYTSSVHRLTTDWTGCAGVVGDDVYPYPDTPNPTVENVAYGIGKYCGQHSLQQAIALQCYSKDGINDPTYAMMSGWLTSVYAYMQPRVILWFAYPDLLTSPNPGQLWSDLTRAIQTGVPSVQTSLGEVDVAVYAKLTGDSQLVAMLAAPLLGSFAVFDFSAVPENQPFPYITLGDNDEKPYNAFGTRGYLTMRKLHIWDSQYGGFQKSQQILARMNTLLDQKSQQDMPLATQKLVYFLFQDAHQMNDPGDNKILHISVEYESFTQEQ